MSETLNLSKPGSLQTWLDYIQSLNPCHIELGLSRVKKVLKHLKLDFSKTCIIEVAGTNGKGSTAALSCAILKNLGLKTGLYTSPHLWQFNERVVIDGQPVASDLLADAFSEVYAAAKKTETELTYFEYTTLAAFLCFSKAQVDVMVLEIGLGGRLDAVNVLDADIAIITSIGLDHTKILGDTVAKIAFEKAGIIKKNSYCITGVLDKEALDVVKDAAYSKNAKLYVQTQDFDAVFDAKTHYFNKRNYTELTLSAPKVPECCVAAAIKCAEIFAANFRDKSAGKIKRPLSLDVLNDALEQTYLPGRMQLIASKPDIYIDVAHNPPAAAHLSEVLHKRPLKGKRFALIGMLKDKDIESVLKIVNTCFDEFYVASLPTERGESYLRLKNTLLLFGINSEKIHGYDKVQTALRDVRAKAQVDDEIIIMGSFVTVSQACTLDCKLNEE